MADISTKPRTRTNVKTERPRLHKVILLNDDYTPRDFVVTVLKARVPHDRRPGGEGDGHRAQKGACVVAVFQRDIAESKATEATDAGRSAGFPLLFTTEPEE